MKNEGLFLTPEIQKKLLKRWIYIYQKKRNKFKNENLRVLFIHTKMKNCFFVLKKKSIVYVWISWLFSKK